MAARELRSVYSSDCEGILEKGVLSKEVGGGGQDPCPAGALACGKIRREKGTVAWTLELVSRNGT